MRRLISIHILMYTLTHYYTHTHTRAVFFWNLMPILANLHILAPPKYDLAMCKIFYGLIRF